jgi:hypothetical protein
MPDSSGLPNRLASSDIFFYQFDRSVKKREPVYYFFAFGVNSFLKILGFLTRLADSLVLPK